MMSLLSVPAAPAISTKNLSFELGDIVSLELAGAVSYTHLTLPTTLGV